MTSIIETPEGMFIDTKAGDIFSDEYIKAHDEKFVNAQKQAMQAIIDDGFISYPLWFDNLDGETVEKEAWLPPTFEPSCSEGFEERHGMRYNIYVPSYERAGTAQTIQMLDEYNVKNYYICIDPDQYAKYIQHYPKDRIIIRDITFRDPDVLDLVSSIESPLAFHGHAPLCNFTLSLSRSLGEDKFWFMDDDILSMSMKAFKYDEGFDPATMTYDKDNFYRCSDIKEKFGFNFVDFLNHIETLASKFRNAGFVGLEKFGLVFTLPIMWKLGTRVYTFYLTDNRHQVDHLGNHNNDVITSLELSKHGLVNCLFEGICYNSAPTQVGGGQTEVYATFGTLDKGKVLVRAQPNYAKISNRYNRVHHNVDYNGYNSQRLVGSPKPKETE